MNEENRSPEQGLEELRNRLVDPDLLKQTRAILIGFYQSTEQKSASEEYLDELKELADTFGIATVAKFSYPLKKIDASTYMPKGKAEEVKCEIENFNATLVIIDEEISPAQQRNLEKTLRIPVMDRTELIIEIFAQRALTKEARLQIELAKTKYQFPRLKRLWSHLSRQSSGGVYLKGEGEKQLEIDKRLLKRRMERLQEELRHVEHYRKVQRSGRVRSGIPTFAIIGYTNAGKSTLLNALTQANVFVEDKLFATLDPTTRKFKLPNNQEILLTDTVGFIRKLPHTLVAAFRSTLEEAVHDDILLHLIDVSHPMALEHAKATHAILKELEVKNSSIITVLNKIDLCTKPMMIDRLRVTYPKSVCISALNKTGFDELMQLMINELSQLRQVVKLKIPQSDFQLVSEVKRDGHILNIDYEENYVILLAQVPVKIMHRFKKYVVDE